MKTLYNLLENLVAIPSVSGHEEALAIYCENHLQHQGFQTLRQALPDGRFNVLAEKSPVAHAAPETLPALLLYAHLDTVPADPNYTQDPFTVYYEGQRAYGLGVSDMKGGLALILAAVAQFSPKDYRLKIALGVDEEAFSAGAWTLAQSDWCKDVQLTLVPELAIDSAREHLGIGRAGALGFQLQCRGPRQHGAVPLTEPSAVIQAMQAVQALAAFPLSGNERLVISGIYAHAEGLTHPDSCEVRGTFLLDPVRNAATVFAALQRQLSSPQVSIALLPRPTPVAEAYTVPEDHPAVRWLQGHYEKSTGNPLALAHGWSVADENILIQATAGPVFSFAPVGGFSHRAGEWLDCKSLERMLSLYQNILKEVSPYFAQSTFSL
jgi:acetylornithine deacetylase/succinyl-diaminopimelate desuccinylase-like protein